MPKSPVSTSRDDHWSEAASSKRTSKPLAVAELVLAVPAVLDWFWDLGMRSTSEAKNAWLCQTTKESLKKLKRYETRKTKKRKESKKGKKGNIWHPYHKEEIHTKKETTTKQETKMQKVWQPTGKISWIHTRSTRTKDILPTVDGHQLLKVVVVDLVETSAPGRIGFSISYELCKNHVGNHKVHSGKLAA